jgi:hypothetical protein
MAMKSSVVARDFVLTLGHECGKQLPKYRGTDGKSPLKTRFSQLSYKYVIGERRVDIYGLADKLPYDESI